VEHGGGGGHFGAHPHWQLGPFTLNSDTMIMTWITMAIIIVIAFLATRGIKNKRIPSGVQNFLEMIFENLGTQFEQTLGPKAGRFAPLLLTLFLFLLVSNWLGLIPRFTSPTNDLNTTLGLALMVMGIVHISGIRDKGAGNYFGHYLKPHWLFLPIHMIEEIAKPTTLAFRLFGNILAGEILIVILLMLVPIWMPLPSVAWLAFSTFVGVIQAFIFTMLAMSYISNAVKDEHHD
jgi:F-type H+-transporting ATPase subunit a